MQKSDLTDLEIETQDLKLRLARPSETKGVPFAQPEQTSPPPVLIQEHIYKAKPSPEDGMYIFKSPMVGTFYRKPSPDKEEFAKVGDVISEGDTVCVIEAMKLFNEIESEVSGKIVKVLVDDTTPVEYDQVLFLVDPAG